MLKLFLELKQDSVSDSKKRLCCAVIMSSTSTTGARSMLEEMLAALRLRDEKPKDVPPALPVRPTMRRRPPSPKNSLHMKFNIGSNTAECSSKDPDATKENARPDSRELNHGIAVRDRYGKTDHPEVEDLVSHEEVPEKPATSQSSLAGPADEKLEYNGCNGCAEEEASNKDRHKLHLSRLEELEELFLKTKAELRQKEEENAALLQQVQQYEKKWSLCEETMKSMEEMYQKQIETLKMSTAAVQKSLAANDTVKQPGNSDTMSAEVQTPEGTRNKHRVADTKLSRDADDRCNVVCHLTKEFEQQKQVFENNSRDLTEVKSGQSGSITKSIEDLQQLKVRYKAWNKEYKVRLHDTKVALLKLGKSEGEKPHRRWWWRLKKRNKT